MKTNPLHCIDFYKADHRRQYPNGTTLVYSNLTPRSDKLKCIPDTLWSGHVTFFGLQSFIRDYLGSWKNFFDANKSKVCTDYQRRMETSLGGNFDVNHIAALHDLGYLPIKIKALKEGTQVPIGVPVLTIENTHPDFFWLTNYLESVMSNYLWKPITSATIAKHYKNYFNQMADKTCNNRDFVKFQGHDFSFRGMSSIQDAMLSGAGHLLSFVGTDTVPAIDLLEEYYGANADKELIGCSVAASEHSVMCMGGHTTEIETIKRLITEVYPSGIVSIVSDTWDFWKVITEYARELKPLIMARNGKVVFRPDSGTPEKIVCGDPQASGPAYYGAIELLWQGFGGTTNDKGYKELDPHIGLIYGDSITFDRAQKILNGLESKGFASNNMVLGIGSYTYQFVTRDTFGFAVKSTYGEIDGVGQNIYKNPITDSGTKKSAKGRLAVVKQDKLTLLQEVESHPEDLLEPVYENGVMLRFQSLADIRKIVENETI